MAYGVVYAVFCTTSGKYYVGQTRQPVMRRWQQHQRQARTGCVRLRRALAKYGVGAFTLSILTVCSSREELDAAERYWIAVLRGVSDGYNIGTGGATSTPTVETARRISAAVTRAWADAEKRSRMVQARLGHPVSKATKERLSCATRRRFEDPAAREKQSRAQRGRTVPESTRERMSQAARQRVAAGRGSLAGRFVTGLPPWNKGRRMTLEERRRVAVAHRGPASPVVCVETGACWSSMLTAARTLGIPWSTFYAAVRTGKPCRGYRYAAQQIAIEP